MLKRVLAETKRDIAFDTFDRLGAISPRFSKELVFAFLELQERHFLLENSQLTEFVLYSEIVFAMEALFRPAEKTGAKLLVGRFLLRFYQSLAEEELLFTFRKDSKVVSCLVLECMGAEEHSEYKAVVVSLLALLVCRLEKSKSRSSELNNSLRMIEEALLQLS